MNDEIIKALHTTKEGLAQAAGFDIRRLIQDIQLEEAKSIAQGRIVLPAPANKLAPSDFQKIRFADR